MDVQRGLRATMYGGWKRERPGERGRREGGRERREREGEGGGREGGREIGRASCRERV